HAQYRRQPRGYQGSAAACGGLCRSAGGQQRLQDCQDRTRQASGGGPMSGIILPGADGMLFQRDRDWHPPADTPGYKSSTFRAPRHSLLALGPTRSEMTGPTFGHEKLGELDNDLIRNFSQDGNEAIGQRMIVY